MQAKLETVLRALPSRPGIYIFKDERGEVIYVGKASSLRHRVNSYFQQSSKLTEKTRQLADRIDSIQFVVTESEVAALILECQQIKKFQPHFNVLLKDDKSFPYIKVDVKNPWPTISITRKRYNDGARYIGRIPSAWSARQTFDLIKKIFPLRSCNKAITGKDARPCLNYHIKRCLSPCTGRVSPQDYRDIVRQVVAFLEGREEQLLRELKEGMKQASAKLEYERAGQIRDQINAIEAVIASHSIPFNVNGEVDAVTLARDGALACAQVLSVSDRKLKGDEHYIMEGVAGDDDAGILESFIKQYYATTAHVPKTILLPLAVPDSSLISGWLRGKRGSAVDIRVPGRGTPIKLLQLSAENARQQLNVYIARRAGRPESIATLNALKEKLGLGALPRRIEAYDISNIQGTSAVGSMVVFENGIQKPAQYRRFRVKTVPQADDYSMMREVLQRRFATHADSGKGWENLPDLVLIDGGRGHLRAAVDVIRQTPASVVPVISIAKENEDIFMPGKAAPVDFDKSSPELHLLQKIRDESHRFAVTYHRKLRSRQATKSSLDDIEGIGPARKKALIRRFGSVHGIKQATIEELQSVAGITRRLAERISAALA